jgi:hypothetical protein
LPGADAGKAGKTGLADIGSGQKSDEFGVLERSHGYRYRTQFHLKATVIPEFHRKGHLWVIIPF